MQQADLLRYTTRCEHEILGAYIGGVGYSELENTWPNDEQQWRMRCSSTVIIVVLSTIILKDMHTATASFYDPHDCILSIMDPLHRRLEPASRLHLRVLQTHSVACSSTKARLAVAQAS